MRVAHSPPEQDCKCVIKDLQRLAFGSERKFRRGKFTFFFRVAGQICARPCKATEVSLHEVGSNIDSALLTAPIPALFPKRSLKSDEVCTEVVQTTRIRASWRKLSDNRNS